MTLYIPVLWFYVLMASLIFGAGVYETFVVHPAWSRKPPESLRGFVGTPVSRMNISAFWVPVNPLYTLSALAALGLAFRAGSLGGSPHRFYRMRHRCRCVDLSVLSPHHRTVSWNGRRGHATRTPAKRGPPLGPTQLDPRRADRNFLVGSPQRLGDARMNPAGLPLQPTNLYSSHQVSPAASKENLRRNANVCLASDAEVGRRTMTGPVWLRPDISNADE
jgi:hypothetical protein